MIALRSIASTLRYEPVTIVTLLGYRFLDAATDRLVRDGLRVTARLVGDTARAVAARTAGGFYAFHRLPGLRALEHPSDALPPTTSPPGATDLVVEIEDLEGRFSPVVHLASVPLDDAASPPETPPLDFYLFSAPTRPPTPGLAAVRARLLDEARAPVAFAVLDVTAGSRQGFGISDADGNAAVFFPTPAVETVLGGSPPSGGVSLRRASWPITARVRHEPGALVVPLHSDGPTLASVFAQTEGRFLDPASPPSAPTDTLDGTLVFGAEAVLRSGTVSHVTIAPAP